MLSGVCVTWAWSNPPINAKNSATSNSASSGSTASSLLFSPPDGFQLARFREIDKAKQWAEARLKEAPNDTDVLYLKAWLDHTTHDTNDLLNKTDKLIKLKAHLGFAHKMKSEALVRKKEYAKALAEINEAIRLMPHESTLYSVRRGIYQAQGRETDANHDKKIWSLLRQLYFAWIKVVPQNFESLKPSSDRNANFTIDFAAGQKALERSDFPAAAEYFSRAIQMKPDCTELYLYRGACYETTDQWKKAIADYSRVIALGQDKMIALHAAPAEIKGVPFEKWPTTSVYMAEAFKRRARCYCFLNDHKAALADMNIAVMQEPEDRWTVEFRGSVLTSSKKFAQAVADYQKAEILEPTYMNASPKLIVCLKNSGDYAGAVRRLSWLLSRNPEDEAMLIDRASALSKLGMHKEAIHDLTSVIKSEPDLLDSYLSRAREFETIGKFKDALADYDVVLTRDKENTQRSTEAGAGKRRVRERLKKTDL